MAARDIGNVADSLSAGVAEVGGEGRGVDEEVGRAGRVFLERDDDVGAGLALGVEPEVVGASVFGGEGVLSAPPRPTRMGRPFALWKV